MRGQVFSLCLVLGLATGGAARASEQNAPEPAPAAAAKPADAPEPKADYCANITDAAAEARHVLQLKALEDLQIELDKKIAILEEKKAAIEALAQKNTSQVQLAQKGIVEIYAKMKPDVAAAQLEILEPDTAVEILRNLNPRTASTILNEMKAPLAAAITGRMAAAAKPDNGTAQP
jgi:flagellar motility protein MotE (MotC chaperone)